MVYDELLFQTIDFTIDQLATIILKKKKPQIKQLRARPEPNVSLSNLVTFMEDKLNHESIEVRGA